MSGFKKKSGVEIWVTLVSFLCVLLCVVRVSRIHSADGTHDWQTWLPVWTPLTLEPFLDYKVDLALCTNKGEQITFLKEGNSNLRLPMSLLPKAQHTYQISLVASLCRKQIGEAFTVLCVWYCGIPIHACTVSLYVGAKIGPTAGSIIPSNQFCYTEFFASMRRMTRCDYNKLSIVKSAAPSVSFFKACACFKFENAIATFHYSTSRKRM